MAGQTVEGSSTGPSIYANACAPCHGPDGHGMPEERVGFETPLPDFTDCSVASPETAADWFAVVHDGGPARAFDRRMPAFGEALSAEEIEVVVAHVRSLCVGRAWPRGELNLPRPLVTEKAFPENETVVEAGGRTGTARAFTQQIVYEHRLGARSQYEIAVPFEMRESGERWERGLGDSAVAVKSALFHDLDSGRILTRQRRRARPCECPQRPQCGGPHLLPVGLVRRRAVRWLALGWPSTLPRRLHGSSPWRSSSGRQKPRRRGHSTATGSPRMRPCPPTGATRSRAPRSAWPVTTG